MSGFEWAAYLSDGIVGCAVIAGIFITGWALGASAGAPATPGPGPVLDASGHGE
jgi:hypothetical protein